MKVRACCPVPQIGKGVFFFCGAVCTGLTPMNCGPKLVLRPFLGKNPQENCQYILHLVGEGGVIHVQDVELTFFWARGVYYERTSWAYPHLVLHAKIYFSLNQRCQ